MKRILLTSALIIAAATGTVSAQPAQNQLSVSQRQIVHSYLPNADLDNLRAIQVSAISAAIVNRDSDFFKSQVFGDRVKIILNW
ncbi:MAG: hypothetical protein ACJASV_000928 [Pseudorhodobacter sp.]|jgi:hypothetical protein